MNSDIKVKVKQGTVIGGEGSLPNGGLYNFFQGIPYAVPPLGELRFKAPVPLESFSTPEIDCTKEGNISLQTDVLTDKLIGSEDCLFLNVYTPKTESAELLPVMVYLYGGGFVFGSGNSDFYNPLYLMQEDVVVVTLNYRLGVLGFLALPEGDIPGNAALKDQRLALQWVKENIAQFNGDPNNVTLFGDSAGSAMAHYHLLSENSRKLFHKAILQSGLSNMAWAIDDKWSIKAKKMAKSMGCTSDDPFEMVKFLQSYKDPNEFVKRGLGPPRIEDAFTHRPVTICPVIEKESPEAVVTKSPLDALSEENSIDIPVMLGNTSAEGIVALPSIVNRIENYNDFRKLIPQFLKLKKNDPRSYEFANSIRQFYFKGESLSKRTLNQFVDLMGDISYNVHAYEAAEIHSKKQHKSPLFIYRFDYDGALNIYKNKICRMKNIKGACHADDIFYIFQATLAPEPWGEAATKMVKTMCKLWTNFAKYSDPTRDRGEQLIDCTWEPVEKIGDKDSFVVNTFIIDEQQKMVKNPNEKRMAFWKNVKNTYN